MHRCHRPLRSKVHALATSQPTIVLGLQYGGTARLGRRHKVRAHARAPPHSPAETAPTGVGPAEFAKLADVPAGGPDVGEGEAAAGAQHPGRLADGLRAGPELGMLCTTRLLTITSTLSSSNGRSVMSAVRTSTRSATPSSSALRSVFCCELSVWSARQMSTPIARPFGSSLAAASRTAPRPQPRSSSVSSPRSPQIVEDLGPHLELADARGADEQRRRRDNRRAGSAANHRGDGLAAHKTSGRRREQSRR